MNEPLRLMGIFAHPDDESMGAGPTLAKYAAEGVETFVVTATRGQRGWMGAEQDDPGPDALGQLREAELCAAAQVLGIREVTLLNYMDGELDQANPNEVIPLLVQHLRRIKPQVVITFDPFGGYGHPDHIAISQFTAAAISCAADANYGSGLSHRVQKLYYMVTSKALARVYESFGIEPTMNIDGVERRPVPWEEWAVTTRIDTAAHALTAWHAIRCHASQVVGLSTLDNVSKEQIGLLLGYTDHYRAFSLVNGGRQVERDLFEGVRATVPASTRAPVQMEEALT